MLGLQHAHICRLIREGNQPPKKGMLCIVGNFWLRCWCERDNLIANSSPIFLAGREIGNATIELAVWKATCAWISHAWQSKNNNGGDIFPHARTYSIFGHAMPCISLCGVYSSKQNTPLQKMSCPASRNLFLLPIRPNHHTNMKRTRNPVAAADNDEQPQVLY